MQSEPELRSSAANAPDRPVFARRSLFCIGDQSKMRGGISGVNCIADLS
jgi:hypothetical protein